jgi:hypothetical protein
MLILREIFGVEAGNPRLEMLVSDMLLQCPQCSESLIALFARSDLSGAGMEIGLLWPFIASHDLRWIPGS